MSVLFAKNTDKASGSSADNAADKAAERVVDEQCQQLINQGALREALALLMESYGTSVYAFCCNMLRDTITAADVLQTTFVQAFNNLMGFEKKLSFRVWLLTIARNRCVDHLRSLRRREMVSTNFDETADLADTSPLADQRIQTQQMLKTLEHCLEEFRVQAKDSNTIATLLLRFRENLPYEQISKILGSSTVALRVRVTRVLPRLKQCMESKGGRL